MDNETENMVRAGQNIEVSSRDAKMDVKDHRSLKDLAAGLIRTGSGKNVCPTVPGSPGQLDCAKCEKKKSCGYYTFRVRVHGIPT